LGRTVLVPNRAIPAAIQRATVRRRLGRGCSDGSARRAVLRGGARLDDLGPVRCLPTTGLLDRYHAAQAGLGDRNPVSAELLVLCLVALAVYVDGRSGLLLLGVVRHPARSSRSVGDVVRAVVAAKTDSARRGAFERRRQMTRLLNPVACLPNTTQQPTGAPIGAGG